MGYFFSYYPLLVYCKAKQSSPYFPLDSVHVLSVTKSVKKKAGGLWPHWCVYVGWTLCLCVSLVAAFFTLLYGIKFGKRGQEEWLVSLFTSVIQDIFVSQPLKVNSNNFLYIFLYIFFQSA